MRPPLTLLTAFEVTEEGPSPTLAVENDEEPENNEDEGKTAKGNTDTSAQGHWAVIRGWYRGIRRRGLRNNNLGVSEWVAGERHG